jgi:putative spermidine/putrescine transport system permease protein
MDPGRQSASERPTYFAWFVAPSILAAAVLTAALAVLLQYAFRQHVAGSLQVGGFTLENFGRMSNWVYLRVFVDSVLLATYTAVLSLLLGYPLALALVRTRSTVLKGTIMIATIIPLFTGDIVRTYSWLIMLGKNGFINGSLKWAGVIDTPIELLYTMLGVTLALVQYSLPVMVIMLAAAISHINTDYEKAASNLGANSLDVLWHVTLPLSMPGILSGTVTIFAWTLSAFATPQLVGGGKVNMVSNMVYQLGFSNFDFPFAATLSLLSLGLIFGILGLLSAAMRRLERLGMS